MLLIITLVNCGISQRLGTYKESERNTAWKHSKLYVVKTQDAGINSALEAAVKNTFKNYAGTVSQEGAEKLMKNENNFLLTVYYNNSLIIKQNAYDKYVFNIGIFQANEKKFKNISRDVFVCQEYTPAAPNLNVTFVAKEVSILYSENEFGKTFEPEANMIAMIPSTILNFQQFIDAMDKTENVPRGLGDIKTMKAVSKILSVDAKILKNKTLLVLNSPFTEEFYNNYAFKKEKVEKNDLSKIISKDKGYCFLKYSFDVLNTLMKQLNIIDCETGAVIYSANAYNTSFMTLLTKKHAEELSDAVNGKIKNK